MDLGDLYFTVSTAGHVDHGKTSVLKKLTGIDTDRLKEEKERQMTTDLGFAHLKLAAPDSYGKGVYFQVGFIDVPGHGKFLKNMIAGVGALDLALLVVAADEGPMPQTIQHIEILALLGLTRILLVVNKIDLTNEATVKATIGKVSKLLADYNLQMVDAVPISCLENSGFENLKNAIACALAQAASRTLSDLKHMPAYLPIDRAFSMVGHGLVVTGTLVRGCVRQGDSVHLEPAGIKARVRALETFGNPIQLANPGQRLALNLAVKEHEKIKRGQSVLGQPISSAQTLLVLLEMFSTNDEGGRRRELKPQPLRFYHGTSELTGSLAWADQWPVRADSRRQAFLAQIALDEPLIAEPKERFALRFGDENLAGGAILLKHRPKWLNRKLLAELSHLILDNQYEDAILWFAQNCPNKTFKRSSFDLFLPLQSKVEAIKAAVDKGRILEVGEFLITEQFRTDLQNQIWQKLVALESTSEQSNKSTGPTLEQLRMALLPPPERAIFLAIVDKLIENGQVVREGERLSSAQAKARDKAVKIDDDVIAKVEKALKQYVCIEIDVLRDACQLKQPEIDRIIKNLEGQNKAKRIAHEFVCPADSLKAAHETVARLWNEKKQITPSQFKESMNITRKYAMAILSHFDDTQVTRRVADGRILLKNPIPDA